MIAKKISFRLKFVLIISVLLLCLTESAWASSSQTPEIDTNALFHKANQYYGKGLYTKAIQLYSQIHDAGLENGILYFNLGNAYLKQGQKGRAILCYEKARRFIPLDQSLQTNLALALRGVNEGEINWGHVFYSILTHLAPLNCLTLGSSICFYIMIFLIIVVLLFPARWKRPDMGQIILGYKIVFIFVCCLFLSLLTLTTLSYLEDHQLHAVSLHDKTPVMSEPQPKGTIYFNLEEGSRVDVRSTRENWCLIKRQDGKRGWVRLEQLGLF